VGLGHRFGDPHDALDLRDDGKTAGVAAGMGRAVRMARRTGETVRFPRGVRTENRNSDLVRKRECFDLRIVSSTMPLASNRFSTVNDRLPRGRFLSYNSLAFRRFRAPETCGRAAPVWARNPP